jgi:CheY-like chemotaxis protein
MLRDHPALKNTTVVALTAFPSSATGSAEAEFDAYLRKPIDPFALTQAIWDSLHPQAS